MFNLHKKINAFAIILLATNTVNASENVSGDCNALLDSSVKELNSNKTINLCETYKNKVLLVVNTASKCGFTPQYEGLENLYRNFKNQGFVVLGFPSNDFGQQEPESEVKVQQFCRLTYGVEFPMFEKTHVRRDNASPFYQALIKASGEAPHWNFHKYLIGRNGQLIESFSSKTKPEDKIVLAAISKALKNQ